MVLKGIILSLALLCCIAGGRSEPQCAFSIPVLLKSGEMVTGCLDVKRHTEPVNVNILLEVSGVNYTILNEQIPNEDTFKCVGFQVPNIAEAAPVFLTVTAVANNFNYTARRAVVVAPTGKATLMQLERSIYKPRQKVYFNVISLDNNLKPVEDKYPKIYVVDPSGNRLYEWNDQETVDGLLSLSFDILDDPEFGQYTIQVERDSRSPVSKSFGVDEYVIPNFKLELSAPNSITILDKTMAYKAIAKYTYGLGVPGKVSGRVCRAPINFYPGNACNRNPDGICVAITGAMDSNGTFSGKLDLTSYQFDRSGYNMALKMELTLTEAGTGIQVTETKYISVNSQLGRVFFNRENMEGYYNKGLRYYVELTAKDGSENPLSDQIIELQVNGITVKNVTTDSNGKAIDFIDTSELDQPVVNIQVIYKNSEQCYDSNYIVPTYSNDYYSITRSYSRSGSFVQIERPKEELQCGQTYPLKVHYIFGQSGLQEGETTADFRYMIMSRTMIIDSGKIQADLSKSLQGELTISVEITPDHAPGSDIVVYCMLEKEVIASTIHLNTENCFRNQVSSRFSQERATPGSTVSLDITSAPRSVCAVRIYDSGLLLLRQDDPITPASVYSSLLYNRLIGYYAAGFNVAPPDPPCVDPKPVLLDGLYYQAVDYQNEQDALQQLSNVGMLFISKTNTKKPTLCGQPSFSRPFFDGTIARENMAFSMAASASGVFAPIAESVASAGVSVIKTSYRTRFSEVWFFNRTRTSGNGSASLLLEVPGTITEWRSDTVCLDSVTGFGMTRFSANITSFQDFFITDVLPYSVIRRELLNVRIVVSNSLPMCGKVRVFINPSDDFTIEALDETQCVCFGQKATFSFIMTAKSVGVLSINITGEAFDIGESCDGPADPNMPSYKDTIVRTLIVESEGIPNEVTKSTLLCAKDSSEAIPIEISPPENAVQDSIKAKITVIGDILGRALVNPESMMRDPAGCGEQNLATLMPLALVYRYQNITGRLTEDTRSRLVQFMGNGYRRQLQFRTSDGGFSAFASGRPSSWLTLKTLETFLLIKPYTMVEDRIIEQALLHLERLKNRTTGGFTPQGTLFNNALKGGAENDVSFTAALAAFLLQSTYEASPTLLREALNFLVAASQTKQSVYNTALLFYVFQVAGNDERSQAMLATLKEQQIEKGGAIYWERLEKPNKPKSYIFSPRAASAEIEITSYVLKALTIKPSPSQEELGYMSQIALWLSQQQNAFGSYSTTADTVVALDALCSYGVLVYQKDASNSVAVNRGAEVIKEFTLDSANRNMLQTQPLTTIPGNYSVSVSGNGCVLLQATVNFHTPVNEENSAFHLSVSIPSESCVDGVAYTLPMQMNVSYNGLRNQSNMALIDVDLPSGYTVERRSLSELKMKVPKVEEKNNHVFIYLESVASDIISMNLTLQMTTRVQNLQSKNIKIWDYYEQVENARAVLHHPCSVQ